MKARVPLFATLSEEEQRELEQLVLVFLEDKTFEGAAGLEITLEMRVVIATQACILLLHRDTDVYPDLDTILVYPSTFVADKHRREGLVEFDEKSALLGESWQRGLVILAWDEVERETHHAHGASNVVLHEFAHQLDAEEGAVNGAPALGSRARYATWARVLGAEFEDLTTRVQKGLGSDIDAYGATNPPEFFAVVTEMFFEKPRQLRNRHAELYRTLADFYQQDPAENVERSARG